MPQARYIRFNPKSIGILGWLIAAVFATLMLVAVAFVGVVALALGAGLLVLGAVLRLFRVWLPRPRRADPARPGSARSDGEIIEAEYRVVREVDRRVSSDGDRPDGDGGRGGTP